MINKEYWENFYKLNIAPDTESDFARFVNNYIEAEKKKVEGVKLIDVACGNGRDSFFFAKKGIDTTGIDISVAPNAEYPSFERADILDYDYNGYNLIYMRFIVHALKESELDSLLKRISLIKNEVTIFIETRSSKGVTDERKSETFFKSSIGEKHFRMLYSEPYLTRKLEAYFTIEQVVEDTGLSIYKGEDPVCIRYVLTKKK